MVIGKMPCLQMCSCYPSLCVLKRSFSSSWFVVLCKYNECTSFEIKIQVFAQEFNWSYQRRPIVSADTYFNSS